LARPPDFPNVAPQRNNALRGGPSVSQSPALFHPDYR